MKKWKLLPGLALKGVIQNGTIFYPYVFSCMFSVFAYYLFSSILENDLIETLPYSAYAWIMLKIGKVLLAVILVPFIYYANSFLVKRRKKEMGLYMLLGMEQKHLILLLFFELLYVYLAATLGGILIGSILAKLFFLLLLRLSNLPIEAEFVFTWEAVRQTLVFFAVVSLLTLLHGIWGVLRTRPVELLSGSKKGEKEPRFPLAGTFLGILVVLAAYRIVFRAKLDSSIFTSFFLSVLLAVVGTYLLFLFAGVVVLKRLQKHKAFYYHPANFITISGMYYRMKKSSASLANICIFSTMVMITLTCTAALYAGLDGIQRVEYPYDARLNYEGDGLSRETAETLLKDLSGQYGLSILHLDSWGDYPLEFCQTEDRLEAGNPDAESRILYLITLEDYERLTKEKESLEDRQVLLYSTGPSYGYEQMDFFGIQLNVKESFEPLFPWPYTKSDYFKWEYVMVVRDEEARQELLNAWAFCTGEEVPAERMRSGILLDGLDQSKADFLTALGEWKNQQSGYPLILTDGIAGGQVLYAMNGGLLFIGILFGLLFFMCLLLVMYYKQLSEGYEDQGSFAIMQKVGMGEEEIHSTVRRQMLTVFAFPLLIALVHFAVGIRMVDQMMAVLRMFNTPLLFRCALAVAAGFAGIYVISYGITSKAYDRIVAHCR